MQQLPKNLSLIDTQDKWAAIINPVITNPVVNGLILTKVVLTAGDNVINHKLGRALQGWKIVRMRNVFAQIYDTQDTNNLPQLTLNLNASTNVIVDIEVY